MTHLDERLGISRNAIWLLPLLLLPGLVQLLLLWTLPGHGIGAAAVVVTTIAVSWYWIGGAITVSHFSRSVFRRRALAAIRAEVEAAPGPVWVSGCDGKVLLQNVASIDEFGDAMGQSICQPISHMKADPAGVQKELRSRAVEQGCAQIVLEGSDALAVRRVPGAALQVWSYRHADLRADHAEMVIAMGHGNARDEFETLPVALMQLTADGYIRRANAAARQLLKGHLPEEPGSAIHLGSLLDGPGRPIDDWLGEVSAGYGEKRTEMLRLRCAEGRGADGQDRYFQLSLSPAVRGLPGFLAVLTDASELKTLEAQFAQSQKMQAIGQLAGGVAHDFNNLLTAINGHCDLLMLRHDKSDPDYADLDQISQNTNRAAALVGQLLSFSRKQKLTLEQLDLRDVLADLAHLLNRLVGGQVALHISYDPALMLIRADRRLLEQVIMNLVVNARDAMPEGGDIRLQTENLSLEMPLTRDGITLPAGEYVCINVRDNGCGIAPEHLDKIFEPFFTTKSVGEGTGLGLSTVYGIVKQTGGYVFCDSELGEGTRFSVYFSAQTGALPETPVNTAPVATAMPVIADRPATVLLVEDEASVRAVAVRALRLKGYEVLEADGADAAFDLLKNADMRVDVFVTDVVMPGMNDPAWVRAALDDRPGTRVVFMSGYSEDVFPEGQDSVPNSVFLAKPFTLVDFTRTVQEQITATRAEPARS
ncbi:ATP-binding protein [Paracoccus saliphilus]|nr:ATP-binding protein [Paracoccus saliphilus]SIS85136.1 two-component system, cell cycle sensor histidine kinase and response regulator CckA [Paracoccus saliphilus]